MEDIKWDRTELSVDDVSQDSPIWRAAITSLSRRTTALEAACRAILEAVDALRRQLLSTQSAQASLDDALSSLARVAPGFGACAKLTLFAERDRESTRLAKLLADLQQHVKSPAELVLDHCQRAQELQRTFDIESKDYYAYVQRWLAVPALSRSAPLSLKSEQAASDGIQQRLDMGFALLRLELYSSLWALHGGEDELLLATHCLAYASQAVAGDHAQALAGEHAQDTLQTSVQSTSAAAQLSEQRQIASVRRAEIELRILSLRMQLGRSSPTERDDEHPSTSSSRTSPPKSAFDHHKFKRILGGSYAQTSIAADNHAQRRNPMRHLRDKINKRGEKMQPQSGLMDGFSPRSDAAPITKDLHAPVAVIMSPAAEDDAQTPRNQPIASGLLPASPPKRSVSVNGGPMLPSQHSTMRKARAGHTSLALGDSDINSNLSTTRDQGAPPLHKQPTPSERRKEGLLWIMSRNLQSPVGADAPKSANKASHWQDSWVVLSNGQLGEYADWRDAHSGATTLSPNNTPIDLRFASVKDAKGMNRRWAFEVVTRDSVRRFYQARSEKEMREWAAAINRAIESLLNGTGTVRQVDKVVAIDRKLDYAKSPTLPRASADSNLRDTSDALLPLVDKTPRRSRKQSSLGAGSPVAEPESPWSHLPLISRNGRRSVGSSTHSGISNVTPVFDYVSAKSQPDASRQENDDKPDPPDLSSLSGIAFPRTSLGSTPPSPQRDLAGEIAAIARLPDNNQCFDCKASDPQWASWALHGQSFVVFLCIRCSGLHRGLGVQISKVKSVTLDQWTPAQVAAARRCGNLQGRLIWEAYRPTGHDSPANLTADFWKQKYVLAAWRDDALWRQICQQNESQVVDHQSEVTKTPSRGSGGFEEDHHPRLALDTRRPSRASIDLLRGPASLVPSMAQ
ncbi:unnamed protein product [Jaminaea pallidilutea]